MYILKIKFIFLSLLLGGCTFNIADKDFGFGDKEICHTDRWERDRVFHERFLTDAQNYYQGTYQ